MRFRDRQQAGLMLSHALGHFRGKSALILALPRGGVPVAAEIAHQLDLPLNLLVIRKIGHPSNPEYAIGAVAEDGHTLLQPDEARALPVDWLQKKIAQEHTEALRRREAYLPEFPHLARREVIIVDDGIATGLTMRLAIAEARHFGARRITVAVPVAPLEMKNEMQRLSDDYISLSEPALFSGVGASYDLFDQLTDDDVRALLR